MPEQLAAIQLVGGSSRIPAVEAYVRREFPDVAVHRRGDPKSAVALGALLASTVSLTPAPIRFGSSEEQRTPPAPIPRSVFSGRSDYEEFILNGIPAGGLFSGAEVVKTSAQVALWGGEAGEQFDPCYHEPCDTYNNNNNSDVALDVNSDAIAFAVLTYAYSTESVNGIKGKKVPGNFTIPAPAGPQGTGAGGGFKEHPGD